MKIVSGVGSVPTQVRGMFVLGFGVGIKQVYFKIVFNSSARVSPMLRAALDASCCGV